MLYAMGRSYLAKEFSELESIFKKEGLRPALIYLNSLTKVRFTGFYQFHDKTLRTLTFYDRENPQVIMCRDVHVKDTYCYFTRQSKDGFTIIDAPNDARLEGHSARQTVQSYCGLPIINSSGEVLGTLCHFDLEPRQLDQLDKELLNCMAKLLSDDLAEKHFAQTTNLAAYSARYAAKPAKL